MEVLRHSLKSIKPNKLHILFLLACIYRFINIETALLEILDQLRFGDVVEKIKPAHILNRGVGHSNSHLDEMVDHL